MFDNSGFVAFADHAGTEGWSSFVYSNELENLLPQFDYGFGCATCGYRSRKADLFCVSALRKGAIGYMGAVENMYGHHMLNEFLDEILINGESIGYAFKIGKNKEARYDWKTPVPDVSYLRDKYGAHDILIGDPTFKGDFGK